MAERISDAWKLLRQYAALSGVGVRESKAHCQPAIVLVAVIVAPGDALHWEDGAEAYESALALEASDLRRRDWKRVLKERWVCAMFSLMELLAKPASDKYMAFLERKMRDESRKRRVP